MLGLLKKQSKSVLSGNGVEYRVRVENNVDRNLVFDNRQTARDYKKVLSKSKEIFKSHIYKCEYDHDFTVETEVW